MELLHQDVQLAEMCIPGVSLWKIRSSFSKRFSISECPFENLMNVLLVAASLVFCSAGAKEQHLFLKQIILRLDLIISGFRFRCNYPKRSRINVLGGDAREVSKVPLLEPTSYLTPPPPPATFQCPATTKEASTAQAMLWGLR